PHAASYLPVLPLPPLPTLSPYTTLFRSRRRGVASAPTSTAFLPGCSHRRETSASDCSKPCATPRSAAARGSGQSLALVSRRCEQDRKSTRLNSSHQIISYAVFCLKKKQH